MDGTLSHGRRFVNSSSAAINPLVQSHSDSSSSSSTGASTTTTLPISSSLSVGSMSLSPNAPVPNPIASIPSTTYTGQALLTGGCAVPEFTAFPLSDGSYLAAPVVGCAEANPQCCPSLSEAPSASTIPTASIIPLSEANSALVNALNADPLTRCPSDYTSTAGNCCPIGFSLFNQQIIGQTPCYSILPQSLPIPAAASDQISSLSAVIAATATAPNPTVSVHIITDEIFALSLPLKNGVEVHNKGGLSLGAKVGIGLGAGFGAIIAILLIAWLCIYNRKVPRNKHTKTASNTSDISAWVASTGGSTAVPPVEGGVLAATGPGSTQSWLQKQGNVSGTGSEQMWNPSQQQYFRTPPPRASLGTMQGAQPPGDQTIFSELPVPPSGNAAEAGRGDAGWYGQHQQQTYGQAGPGYGQGQEAPYITYPSPPDRAELGNSTPRPTWWRQ